MSNHPNRGRNLTPRPIGHLHATGAMYPNAWQQIGELLQHRDTWPAWCLLPTRQWTQIVSIDSPGLELETILADAMRLCAIGTWRYTQSTYKIDPALYSSLIDTPIDKLPSDLLMRLPEWSVYIETPGATWLNDSEQFGFWAALDYDANKERPHLILLIDSQSGLDPIALHLGDWAINEGIKKTLDDGRLQGMATDTNKATAISIALPPLINLLLYVCSDGVEYNDAQRPSNPTGKQTPKKGWRLFPAAKPRTWNLGRETGTKLRRAQAEYSADRSGPAPHVRRAHWHTFRRGPRTGQQELFVKFLPPTAVNSPEG